MELPHILALAILQGLTEFLPISSSAHLILLPIIAGWQDQGLAFDVAVHVGTLSAVIFYFRKTLKTLIYDWSQSIILRKQSGDSYLAWAVLLATIPAGLAGLLLNDLVDTYLRSPVVIATTTIGFGLLLGWADWYGKRQRTLNHLNWKDILYIGIAQAISLIPGTSRSGITMTAGLMLGLDRQAAAQFSFLLSIPIIFLAGGWIIVKLINSALPIEWSVLAYGALFSAISAYLCIYFFMKLINQIGMLPFVIYRLILGCILLVLFV